MAFEQGLADRFADALPAEVQASLLARSMDRSLVWESLRWLRGLWDGPLVLKGVLGRDKERMLAQVRTAIEQPDRAGLRAEWMRGL